jgi:hypothetical protein
MRITLQNTAPETFTGQLDGGHNRIIQPLARRKIAAQKNLPVYATGRMGKS